MNHQDIMKKYDLETVPIGIGGKRLEFYRVGNWEPFIENILDENSRFTDFPLWIKIWEASLVLTDYLLDGVMQKTPQTILELGAGMGVTGLFLSAFGHHVTLTDNEDDSLALLRLNVTHNGLQTANIQKLDWMQADLNGQFDILIGAEVIYTEDSIQPFISLCRKNLKPDGTLYLAHDRQRTNVEKFIKNLPKDMTVDEIGKTFTGKDTARRIVIHVIRFA